VNDYKLVAEANLIACAQSMHSVSDILAYVILHSLKIYDIDEGDLSLNLIQNQLEASTLKDEIIKLLGLKEFCYLKDFVNTTKHISIVFSGYNANIEHVSKQEHGLKFNSFSYQAPKSSKIRNYPEKWHSVFLEELKKLSFQYVKIGQEINRYLNNNKG